MKYYSIYFNIVLLHFIVPQLLFSQNIKVEYVILPAVVDSVMITGETSTVHKIIFEELTYRKGTVLDSVKMHYDRERIYSLGIFTRVELKVVKSNELNVLTIYVEDSWNIWPIPFATLRDNDWNTLSVGMDLYFQNFRGRNEKLRIRAAAGFDPLISASYTIPYLLRDEDISLNLGLSYQTVTNRSLKADLLYGGTFEQTFSGASIMVGKRYDIFHKFFLHTSFSYVETPFFIAGINSGINSGSERVDRNFALGARYTYDTRDLIQYPSKGTLLFIDYQFKGLGFRDVDYKILHFDLRNYEKLFKHFIAKGRFSTRQTFGSNIPLYDYSMIGYGERIRGHYNKKMEGNSLFIGSVEIIYPIISNWNISFNIPPIPKELTTYRVEIHSQIFGDAGAVRSRNKPISLRDFERGFGLGLTFLVLPYNIARAEIAFNEKLKSELIFELGISF